MRVLEQGDSGAGYLNPTQLFPPRQYSNLPSAADTWVEHCTPLYRKFDVSFTGYIRSAPRPQPCC